MKKAFLYSLKHSIPIFISFVPVGLAYGVVMKSAGYSALCTALCSLFVYAGSLQFLMIDFFTGGVSLVSVAVMALVLNSRHIFYGLPFIEKWRDYGPAKLFLIYALPDETFSLHCSNDFDDTDPELKRLTYIFDAALVFFYWLALSTLGALVGSLITFDTTGIDFALTALFIVILIEQIKAANNNLPCILAALSSLSCLALFGPSSFILPSLFITVALLILFKGRISPAEKGEKDGQ